MRFALWGGDSTGMAVARAIAAHPEHQLVAVVDANADIESLRRDFPSLRPLDDWQQLLSGVGVDAVLCRPTIPAAREGAKRLAEAGLHLLVVADIELGASWVYEMLPISEEGPTLMPLFRQRYASAWREVREQAKSNAMQYLRIARAASDASPSTVVYTEVWQRLLDDADLARWLIGDYQRVTCLPTGARGESAAMVTVNLQGDGLPETNWTLMAGAGHAESFEIVPAVASQPTPDSSNVNWSDAIGEFVQRTQGRDVGASWTDLVRAFDIVEAAQRSIRRARTVAVNSDDASELSQFKSKMAAAGCGLLLYTMFGVIAALIIGAAFDPRSAEQVRSEAAGFVIMHSAFVDDGAEFTETGEKHVESIGLRLRESAAEILLEPAAGPHGSSLDARRAAAVTQFLEANGATISADRVVIRPLQGSWFRKLMTALWIVVFAPLGLFLAAQVMITLARPAQQETENSTSGSFKSPP